jgi:hypothetical protein
MARRVFAKIGIALLGLALGVVGDADWVAKVRCSFSKSWDASITSLAQLKWLLKGRCK